MAKVTEETSKSAAGSAQWVAAGIMLSRLAGLVREMVFARFFGTSIAADAWSAASRMPNVLQNLLGEGTLSASFIPQYAKLLEEGREEDAGRLAGAIFALLLALAGGLALVGVLLAPVLVTIFAPGFDGLQRELTVRLVRIVFPMAGVLVLSAWALGIQNSHRRFFVPYVAPVVWNGAMVVALLIWGGVLPQDDLVMVLGFGALIGGLLQFLIQLPWVLRLERSLRIGWAPGMREVRATVRNAAPAILARGVVQLSSYVDIILGSLLVAGSVATLRYGTAIYILPLSLFGMSVAAAELPELSRRRNQAMEVLRQRVVRSLRQIGFLVIPSAIGYIAIGNYLVAAIFQRGDFTATDTIWVHTVLISYSIGLVASTGSRLYSSAYFALEDTRTPAKYAIIRVASAAAMGATLMLIGRNYEFAGAPLGAAGLALGSGLGSWIEWNLLRLELRKRMGNVVPAASVLARMAASAVAAAAAGLGVAHILPDLPHLVTGGVVLGVYGTTYFAVATALGLPEVRQIIGRILRRP